MEVLHKVVRYRFGHIVCGRVALFSSTWVRKLDYRDYGASGRVNSGAGGGDVGCVGARFEGLCCQCCGRCWLLLVLDDSAAFRTGRLPCEVPSGVCLSL